MEFDKLIQERRSVRSYDAQKKVTEEQITELIRAMQLAPTWKNFQPGRYYAVLDGEKLEQVRTGCLPEFNQKNCEGAALIVTTFQLNRSGFNKEGTADNEVGNFWGAYDLGLQNAYLVLKAADMGLDTLIMGIRDGEALKKELEIPENEEVMSVIAVGYGNGQKVLHPRKELEKILKVF